jgi:hypothetical protein
MAGSRLRPSGCGIDARPRASGDRILLEQAGDHCGVERGADAYDHVVADIDDPAIPVARSWRQPRYSGSWSRSALLVPTSNTIGNVRSGRIPPMRVYRERLPTGMPKPPALWSPMPRMR